MLGCDIDLAGYPLIEERVCSTFRRPCTLASLADTIFKPTENPSRQIFVKGTPFQLKVWEALMKIPAGHIVSYQSVANYIEKPEAIRAVASAIGKNPVSYLIPCHRVIRKEGNIGEYRC